MKENPEIIAALRTLWDTYTPSLVRDPARVNALLMDCLPQYDRERKLLVSALREGLGTDLLRLTDEGADEELPNRWTRRLMDELCITEEAARFAVSTLVASLAAPPDIPSEGEKMPHDKRKHLKKKAVHLAVGLGKAANNLWKKTHRD